VGRAMQTVIEYFANMLSSSPVIPGCHCHRNFRCRQACSDLDAVIYETIARRRAEARTDGDDLI